MLNALYETDFYAWTQEQATLLKQGKFECLDVGNLIEEIESLGKQQRRELKNRLGILIGYLLKWHYQPENRRKSWRVIIRNQRREIMDILEENPSLQSYLPEVIRKAHQVGLDLVVLATPLDYADLPATPIYTVTQLLDPNFPEDLHPHPTCP